MSFHSYNISPFLLPRVRLQHYFNHEFHKALRTQTGELLAQSLPFLERLFSPTLLCACVCLFAFFLLLFFLLFFFFFAFFFFAFFFAFSICFVKGSVLFVFSFLRISLSLFCTFLLYCFTVYLLTSSLRLTKIENKIPKATSI